MSDREKVFVFVKKESNQNWFDCLIKWRKSHHKLEKKEEKEDDVDDAWIISKDQCKQSKLIAWNRNKFNLIWQKVDIWGWADILRENGKKREREKKKKKRGFQ